MLITLTPSCAVVMKSGNHNFLEPSGPFQARNGTALHSHLRDKPTNSHLQICSHHIVLFFINMFPSHLSLSSACLIKIMQSVIK